MADSKKSKQAAKKKIKGFFNLFLQYKFEILSFQKCNFSNDFFIGKSKKEDWSDNDSDKDLKIEAEENLIAQPVKKKGNFDIYFKN